MGSGRSTPQGRAIAARTRVLAHGLARARVAYWEALLLRPQLAKPVVDALAADLDLSGWWPRLRALCALGRRWVKTRRVGDRRNYLEASTRLAQHLATVDRACGAADAVAEAIGLWAARDLPSDHGFHDHQIYPARTRSLAWRFYWSSVEQARDERRRLRNEIVVANEGLVVHLCGKWSPWAVGHLSREDLHQVAREGLHRAADLYQHDREPPRAFSTYAAWWVQHHVWREHSRRRGDIVAPVAVQHLARKLSPLVDQHGTSVAVLHGVLVEQQRARGKGKVPSLAAVRSAIDYMGLRVDSLHQRVGRLEGQGLTLADVIPDDALSAEEQMDADRAEAQMARIDPERVRERLLGGLERLPAEAREIVLLRHGFQGPALSVAEIAKRRGQERHEVEALERQGLEWLRGAVMA